MKNFKTILENNLESCKLNCFSDNYDYRRFGHKRSVLKDLFREAKKNFASIVRRNPTQRALIWGNLDKLGWLYERLDDESRNILVQLLSYRLLGEKHVKLPLNTSDYWRQMEELDILARDGEKIDIGFQGWSINKVSLESVGYEVVMFARPPGIYNQMIVQQYRCQVGESVIELEDGDVAMDSGGCYGATAMNFALKVGESGRVYTWEFMRENIDIFERNMKLNPDCAKRIELIENPLWSSSGEKLYVSGSGPGTKVSLSPPLSKMLGGAEVVHTYTIDDLRSDKDLDVIDFIKMDIEGAELEALKGSVKTIQQCKPKLAISVYHNIQDFWEIPQWIDSLGLGYKFHLRHFTIHAEETVLFAVVQR